MAQELSSGQLAAPCEASVPGEVSLRSGLLGLRGAVAAPCPLGAFDALLTESWLVVGLAERKVLRHPNSVRVLLPPCTPACRAINVLYSCGADIVSRGESRVLIRVGRIDRGTQACTHPVCS